MFAYLCSYHQVPETVLEYVLAFGVTDEPKDVCLTGFQAEDTLSLLDRQKIDVPSANRSANAIRLSYLLRVVEPSNSSPSTSWNIRQLAVYHSFDVTNGRAFWVTIKPNQHTRENIHKEFVDDTGASLARDTPTGFASTLTMHLQLLEASCENWRWHLDEVEKSLRSIINKAKTAKLDTEPHFDTMPEDIKEKVLHANSFKPVEKRESFYQKTRRSFSNRWNEKKDESNEKKPTFSFFSKPKAIEAKQADASEQERLKKYLVLDLFSFSDVQKLQGLAETIQEGLLALEMNASVLKDIKEYYQHLSGFEAMPVEIRRLAAAEFACFVRKVERLEADLDRKQKQWRAMEKLAQDGKTLYDGILQYRNLQVSRIYAESAHSSSRKMEKIAAKTEEETASMHIITMVTLVFLPGTFFTSFLQSGIFQWNEPVGENEATWEFKKDAFGLFAAITFISMFITFVVWFFMFRYAKGRSRRRLDDLEAGQVEGVSPEK
ncbi:hypothetical protein PG985_011850 [Apiospora marii]|uniref:uncharacterized protein n=1 Tax=Apiospora marii TaxID=335849 RepID=UPI00312E79BB